MKITVMGTGAWGTALAINFARHHQVTLWGRDSEQTRTLASKRQNDKYLPGHSFPQSLTVHEDFADAAKDSDLILVVTPTAGLRSSLQHIVNAGVTCPVLWACKGLEAGSMKLPHKVADETLPPAQIRGVLSGPSFAQEVAAALPCALTLAINRIDDARQLAKELANPSLRIYSNDDVVGVEIGGAVKNVMAIATGVCDGLKLGNNARAALITRGLAEIARFGKALGAHDDTFTGLSGLGDLILTCTGDLSRNRKVGMLLAEGNSLESALHQLGHVAEGVPTAREVKRQAEALQIDMPLTNAVCALLYEGVSAKDVVASLMGRQHKDE